MHRQSEKDVPVLGWGAPALPAPQGRLVAAAGTHRLVPRLFYKKLPSDMLFAA
jgi:hypothetical protein